MKWSFPSNNNGEFSGIGNPGVMTFKGMPMKSLAREICQNSLDAAISDDNKVTVEFSKFSLSKEKFPEISSFQKATVAALAFSEDKKYKEELSFYKNVTKALEEDTITFLRISDFNTTGLCGAKEPFNSPWNNLIKSSGVSNKADTAGGSFGIGKNASFACSVLRTVFYSTLDKDNISAYQGVAKLTTFPDDNGEYTSGTGYYGADNNTPVFEQIKLDENFSRESTGTDIYIAGFRDYSGNWKDDIIVSVLDGFLSAIFSEKLVVKVEDIVINRENLSYLIENVYKNYKDSARENADKYYEVLTSGEASCYVDDDYANDGMIKLWLMIKPGMHRKVAMIRKTGMKIMDRGYISGIIPFAGVMLIEGQQVNAKLRKLENPQHTSWEPTWLETKEDIDNAKKYIKGIIDFIKKSLESLKKEDSSETIDPPVGEYLPDGTVAEEILDEPIKQETLTDNASIVQLKPVKKKKVSNNSEEINNGDISEEEDGDEETETGFGAGHNNGSGKSSTSDGAGYQTGYGKGNDNKKEFRKFVSVHPKKVRVVCLNKENGEYALLFVPSISATNGKMDILLSAESEDYVAPIVGVSSKDNPDIKFSGSQLTNISFIADNPVNITIKLDYDDYCSMEVKAYGHKA